MFLEIEKGAWRTFLTICNMEMTGQIPFLQLLALVRNLTPIQKAKLRKDLDAELTVA